MTMHYNQNPSGWNGFTTLSNFYSKWDQNDTRFGTEFPNVTEVSGLRAGFLVGQQFNENGDALTDRAGDPLIFTEEVDLFYSTEREGVRVIKYVPDYANVDNPGNDYIFLRYADVKLMEAEAELRAGNAGNALTIVNELRDIRGAQALGSVDEAALLDERGFELYWEGWRRQDQIRFGTFLGTWAEKPNPTDPSRLLFPIPDVQLSANPNLVQNPGY